MTNHHEHRIRERAHQLWIDDGQPEGQSLHYWLKAQSELGDDAGEEKPNAQNEGEGNQTAALAYDAEATKFAQSGQVEAKAKEAKAAVDGPEGPELRRAERVGKRRSRGEDPHGAGA